MGKTDLGRLIAQTMAQPMEERTIEAITGDILEAQRKGGEAVLTIGRCLIEAKDMLRHGEWLPWLAEKVGYSEKTAQNFMRLAREFSNPQAIADLGATKALKLLALPADEREQFVADHNVIDMTTRQLEAAIKERDEARAAAEHAAADQMAAEQARDKMAEDMRLLNARLAGSKEEREKAVQDVARLEKELAELKARPVDVAVETVMDQDAIDKAKDEVRGEMQNKLDKAKEAAARAKYRQQEAEAKLDTVQAQLQDAERARKNAAMAADEDMAAFKVLFQQAQENANKIRGILLKLRAREDSAAAQGVEKALKALAEAIGRCVE